MVEFVCLRQDLDEETNNGESFQLSIPLPGSLSGLACKVRAGRQHGIPSISLARFFRLLAGANEQGDGVFWMRSGSTPLRGTDGMVLLPHYTGRMEDVLLIYKKPLAQLWDV